MGNTSDKPTQISQSFSHDPKLISSYQVINEIDKTYEGANLIAFQTLFATYPDIGGAIFHFFKQNGDAENHIHVLPREIFLNQAQDILDLTSPAEQIKLYIKLLCSNKESLTKEDVLTVLKTVCHFEWSQSGKWLPDLSNTETTLKPFISTLFGAQDELQLSTLSTRVAQQLANAFISLHKYVYTALSGLDQGSNSKFREDAVPKPAVLQYSSILNAWSLWGLSCCLGSTFVPFTARQNESTSSALGQLVHTGTWQCLYSSDRDGLSPNRFGHHVFSYKGPTVILILFGAHSFCVTVDEEWRESTESWGSSQCQIIQMTPQWRCASPAPNLIYLNLTARNAPKCLAFGRNPAILIIDDNFEKVKFHGVEYRLNAIEVWGCAGEEALKTQHEQKQWEQQEAERAKNRKLKLDDWKDNPDRQILEMGGVTTEHAER